MQMAEESLVPDRIEYMSYSRFRRFYTTQNRNLLDRCSRALDPKPLLVVAF